MPHQAMETDLLPMTCGVAFPRINRKVLPGIAVSRLAEIMPMDLDCDRLSYSSLSKVR